MRSCRPMKKLAIPIKSTSKNCAKEHTENLSNSLKLKEETKSKTIPPPSLEMFSQDQKLCKED